MGSLAKTREATCFCLDGRCEDGDSIPPPTTRALAISAAHGQLHVLAADLVPAPDGQSCLGLRGDRDDQYADRPSHRMWAQPICAPK